MWLDLAQTFTCFEMNLYLFVYGVSSKDGDGMSNTLKDTLCLQSLILLDKNIIGIISTNNKHRNLLLRQSTGQVGHNPDQTEIQGPGNLEAFPGRGDLVLVVREEIGGDWVVVRDDEGDFFGGLGDAVPGLVVEQGEVDGCGGGRWKAVDCVGVRIQLEV